MEAARPVVLTVDGDAAVRALVTDLLESEGYAVEATGSALEALTWLRDGRPDLVLADLMLPDLSGLELCQQMRAGLHRYVPIVLYSAASGSCWKERSLAAGANDYLAKPFDIDDLLERVSSHLLAGSRAS